MNGRLLLGLSRAVSRPTGRYCLSRNLEGEQVVQRFRVPKGHQEFNSGLAENCGYRGNRSTGLTLRPEPGMRQRRYLS
jgi:hypothetical protein